MSPTTDPTPRHDLLPLVTRNTGRSAMTCRYRCGDACGQDVPNRSDNPYFADMVTEAISRRGLLKAGLSTALVVGAGGFLGQWTAAAAVGDGRLARPAAGTDLTFTPVPPNSFDALLAPDGYSSDVVIRWGDPVLRRAADFDFDAQTADAQAGQFGYNCDYVAVLPLRRSGQALLVVNHEYTNEELMFRGYVGGAGATEEQVRIGMMAHGMSVVEIEQFRDTGRWEMTRPRRLNRRITAESPMELTGPAAGSPLLATAADPSGRSVLGTLNNCAGGTTPWGTVLSGEENFNQYFGASSALDPAGVETNARYGLPTTVGVSGRGWERFEERFDLARHPHEAHRFGWIVEIDPYDPSFVPRKRTMLGRMKHEGATTRVTSDGRVAAYMGDDERFDYVYKFVSAGRVDTGRDSAARRRNFGLLDEGTLYVAQFTGDSPDVVDGSGQPPADQEFDGTGRWIPLTDGRQSFVDGMSVDEVLVFTRLAADLVGATKMDRPEDVQANPVTGALYIALTNNSRRAPSQVDEANPLAPSRHGHIIELGETANDAGALTFTWRIFMICGSPEDGETYFAGYDKSQVSPISSPDNIAFDAAGNLWISTDSGRALDQNDGFFGVPVEGPERGHLKQFLTVPFGAEACGPWITDDQRSIFVAVQHPGDADGANPDNRASTWPDGGQPRPSVAVIWRSAQGSSKRIGA
jgi:secreted PhoX family phosphatase